MLFEIKNKNTSRKEELINEIKENPDILVINMVFGIESIEKDKTFLNTALASRIGDSNKVLYFETVEACNYNLNKCIEECDSFICEECLRRRGIPKLYNIAGKSRVDVEKIYYDV